MGDTGRLPYGDVEIWVWSKMASSPSSRPEISLAVRGLKVELEWAELARRLALVVVLLIAKGKLDFAADASQRLLSRPPICACASVVCGMRSVGVEALFTRFAACVAVRWPP